MLLKDKILDAAKAGNIPEGESGLWTIRKAAVCKPIVIQDKKGRSHTFPRGIYTNLWRYTDATMHKGGELVMTDNPPELATHLEFMLKAHGRVLVSGLGLGCVVRGLLANPAVDFVVCLERDPHVLKLVAPHMPKEKLSIIFADAIEWCEKSTETFDCAWHDIWTDECAGEPALALQHSKLILAMYGRVKFQGAWAFPRDQRRLFSPFNVI
jgi:hypothetical protein